MSKLREQDRNMEQVQTMEGYGSAKRQILSYHMSRGKILPFFFKSASFKATYKMPNDNQFRVATTSLVLSVPPIFAGNLRGGVEEMLDSIIMRYLLFNPTLKARLPILLDTFQPCKELCFPTPT